VTRGSWIDVSVTLRSGMAHWPGNPPVDIRRQLNLARGDAANVSQLSMGSHTGTHMDAPLHFFADGQGLEEMDLEAVIGPARVIEITDSESVRPAELEEHEIGAGERVLFKTRNSPAAWERGSFVEDFVYLSEEAADHLARRAVRCVGVDYLSIGGFHADGAAIHRAILGAGIWVIEGLDLTGVAPGLYELICLPLRIASSDGAPARAVLRPLH
jgi:arylformamidase